VAGGAGDRAVVAVLPTDGIRPAARRAGHRQEAGRLGHDGQRIIIRGEGVFALRPGDGFIGRLDRRLDLQSGLLLGRVHRRLGRRQHAIFLRLGPVGLFGGQGVGLVLDLALPRRGLRRRLIRPGIGLLGVMRAAWIGRAAVGDGLLVGRKSRRDRSLRPGCSQVGPQ
jgi:hypothetical protein